MNTSAVCFASRLNPTVAVKALQENNELTRFLLHSEEVRQRAPRSPPILAALEHVHFQSGRLTIPRSKHSELWHVPTSARVVEILRGCDRA